MNKPVNRITFTYLFFNIVYFGNDVRFFKLKLLGPVPGSLKRYMDLIMLTRYRTRTVFFFISILAGVGIWVLVSQCEKEWLQHPALALPDGTSHRGDSMVATNIDDPRVLAELSRRFKSTAPLGFDTSGKLVQRGISDFEIRQEYFLRLLDHYVFSEQRLIGLTRSEVESIFGPLRKDRDRETSSSISAGRDSLFIDFKGDVVVQAQYVMGY